MRSILVVGIATMVLVTGLSLLVWRKRHRPTQVENDVQFETWIEEVVTQPHPPPKDDEWLDWKWDESE